MVQAALDGLGGKAYLMREAEEHPRAFLALVGKVLAAELHLPTRLRRARMPGSRTGKSRTGRPLTGKSRTGRPLAGPSSSASIAALRSPILRDLVRAALIAVGGAAYLMRQGEENPRAFLPLVGLLLAAELRPSPGSRCPRCGSATDAGEAADEFEVVVIPDEGPITVRRASTEPRCPTALRPAPADADDLQTEGRTPVRPPGTRDLPVAPRQPRPTAAPCTPPKRPDPQPAAPQPAPVVPQPTIPDWHWRPVDRPIPFAADPFADPPWNSS